MRHVGVSLYRREFSGTIPSHVGQYCAAHKYVTRLRHAQSRIHVTVSRIGGGGAACGPTQHLAYKLPTVLYMQDMACISAVLVRVNELW